MDENNAGNASADCMPTFRACEVFADFVPLQICIFGASTHYLCAYLYISECPTRHNQLSTAVEKNLIPALKGK